MNSLPPKETGNQILRVGINLELCLSPAAQSNGRRQEGRTYQKKMSVLKLANFAQGAISEPSHFRLLCAGLTQGGAKLKGNSWRCPLNSLTHADPSKSSELVLSQSRGRALKSWKESQ